MRTEMIAGLLLASLVLSPAAAFVGLAPHGLVLPHGGGARPGWAVVALGDVDGDGLGELALGDPLASRVRLHLSTRTEAVVLEGATGEQLGFALAAADLSGDGLEDLVVGAPYAMGVGGARQAGRVLVFDGASLDETPAARWVLLGREQDARFGSAVAARAGLLAASAPQSQRDVGRVLALDLPPPGEWDAASLAHTVVEGADGGDELGEVGLAFAGAALLVGAPDAADGGEAYLVPLGARGLAREEASRVWRGAPGEELGFDVAASGEVVALGMPGASGTSGRVELHLLGAEGALFVLHGSVGGRLGSSVALGDFDDDAMMDLVAGAPVAQRGSAVPGAIVFAKGPLVGERIDANATLLFGTTHASRLGFDVGVVARPLATREGGLVVGAPRPGASPLLVTNAPPVAGAAGIVTRCTGPETGIMLDAGLSADPDGAEDIRRYAWSSVDGQPLVQGVSPTLGLPPGRATLLLEVTDLFGRTDRTMATVEVVDDTAPRISLSRLEARTVYLEDEALLRLPLEPLLFATAVGRERYVAEVEDLCSRIARVEFFEDETMRHVDTRAPFEWLRDPHPLVPAVERIRAVAYDTAGNSASACLPVIDAGWVSLHHLPILGQGPPPVEEWGIPPRDARHALGLRDGCDGETQVPIAGGDVPVRLPLG